MSSVRYCKRVVLFSLALVLLIADAAVAKKKPPAHPVNLNTATAAELEQVPGIGPATAQKILETPKSYGSFKSVDDLLAIRGIGPARIEKMRKYLTVGKGFIAQAGWRGACLAMSILHKEFEPHPWLRSGHLQTVAAFYARRKVAFPEPEER